MTCVPDTLTWTVMASTWGLIALSMTYTIRTHKALIKLRKNQENT